MGNYKVFDDQEQVISYQLGQRLETWHELKSTDLQKILNFFFFLSPEFFNQLSSFPVAVLKLDELILELPLIVLKTTFSIFFMYSALITSSKFEVVEDFLLSDGLSRWFSLLIVGFLRILNSG